MDSPRLKVQAEAYRTSKIVAQFLVGGFQVFRQNSGVAGGGHKIGVPDPSGQDVDVDVISDTRPCRLSQIHSDIESFRPVSFSQRTLRTLRQFHHLGSNFGRRRVEFTQMLIWNDQ